MRKDLGEIEERSPGAHVHGGSGLCIEWPHEFAPKKRYLCCYKCSRTFLGYICQGDARCYDCVDRGFFCQGCFEFTEDDPDARGLALCRKCTRDVDASAFFLARSHNGYSAWSVPDLRESKTSRKSYAPPWWPDLEGTFA